MTQTQNRRLPRELLEELIEEVPANRRFEEIVLDLKLRPTTRSMASMEREEFLSTQRSEQDHANGYTGQRQIRSTSAWIPITWRSNPAVIWRHVMAA